MSTTQRGLRGRTWDVNALFLAASSPFFSSSSGSHRSIGFRVARLVPEPDGHLLAATVLATLVALRRRAAGNL